VYARQRPGGVAWDAVPLTVRGLNNLKAAGNPPLKSLSLSCRAPFFLSILKTIRSERAESFSLRQGVRFIIDANEGDAPVRKITNGKIQKQY
jgi:hypothetical protein